MFESGIERRGPRVFILVGATIFIVALTGSALVVPQLRVLHFSQALIYVAVAVLAWRGRAWGYGAGVSVPVFGNVLQLFITHNMTLGGIGHFILIVSCLAAFLGTARGKRAYGEFLGGAVLALAYFGVIVATLLPH
jgi:hypothetical protein